MKDQSDLPVLQADLKERRVRKDVVYDLSSFPRISFSSPTPTIRNSLSVRLLLLPARPVFVGRKVRRDHRDSRVRPEQEVRPEPKVIAAMLVRWDQSECLERRERLDLRARRGSRAIQAKPDVTELMVLWDHVALPATKAIRGRRVILDRKVLKVILARRAILVRMPMSLS